jgi:acyl-CoA reductase-like NAD-dependent aldehyde dehydrogenase
LFLPGVQVLQALVAGNAVLLKPGAGGRAIALALQRMASESGIPLGLFSVLDESVASATAAIRSGADKVFLTGSATSGRAVLREAAEQIVPVVTELSGCDAVFVREDANVRKAVAAIVFGMTLNGGATCIAPRRIFVHRTIADDFGCALADRVGALRSVGVSRSAASLAGVLIQEATSHGARALNGGRRFSCDAFPPTVLFDVRPEMAIMQSDLFVPLVSVMRVDSDDEALRASKMCPYSLGATIFGEEEASEQLAMQISAGVVMVNDIIVPTADPRLPFGGSGRSGFGKTRGAEGLLEMTYLKAIVVQRARRLRHLEPPHARAEELFLSFLAARHRSRWRDRLLAWRKLAGVVTRKSA